MKAKKFATQIDEDVLRDLKKFSKQTDKTVSKVVTEAIAEYLQKVRLRPAFQSAMDEVIRENTELLKRLAK